MNKRFLIFYISRFSGHFHAAKAVEEAVDELAPGSSVKLVDAFHYTNPILGELVGRLYLHVIRKKPEIWGNLYDNQEVLPKIKKVREFLHRFNGPKIKKLIEGFSADAVCCTQAFPCGMVADYKRVTGSNIFLVGVLTDHAPHSYWIFDEVDCYIVPSEKTAETLVSKGVPRRKIRVFGIPVSSAFRVEYKKEEIRKKYGLSEDEPAVLVMGGSQGLGAVEEVVRAFLADRIHRYQLIVVTGVNKKLYKRLSGLVSAGHGNVRIFKYVNCIAELMEISDMIVTKAGGITTSEALAKALPILIANPIPGQERMNTGFLVGSGAAMEIVDYSEIYRTITELFISEERLSEMKVNALKLARPSSALDIAGLLIKGS
jgi:processive 1,2-diacylglycerol beta-glucosyltransferase